MGRGQGSIVEAIVSLPVITGTLLALTVQGSFDPAFAPALGEAGEDVVALRVITHPQ